MKTSLTSKILAIFLCIIVIFAYNPNIWAALTLLAGKGIAFVKSGVGGNLTVSLSHLGLENLTDPGANRIFFWNDTSNQAGWLDYSVFLTAESDPAVATHLSTFNHTHYDTAYGWGNHSAAGYLTAETDPSALKTAGTDNVKDTHIDWGSGAGQVDTDDITVGSTNKFANTTKEDHGETAYLRNKFDTGITIGDGNSTMTTGFKGSKYMPFNGTITGWYVTSNDNATTTGNVTIEVWKKTYAGNFTMNATNEISGSGDPAISSSTSGSSTDLSGWSNTTITAGDMIGYNVTASNLKRVTLTLVGEKQ